MDGVQIHIAGDRDLLEAFKELRVNMGRKYLMSAVRKGANIMKTIIVANAPEDTGRLRRNLRIRTRKTRATVRAGVVVNQRGKKDDPRNAFYWYFIEKGHRVRRGSAWGNDKKTHIQKRGRGAGGKAYGGPTSMVDPNPFVERSWRMWSRNAVHMMFQAFASTIDRVAAKQRAAAQRSLGIGGTR